MHLCIGSVDRCERVIDAQGLVFLPCQCINLVCCLCCGQVYHNAAAPVEDFFREHGLLMDFEITGGIPETMPRLLEALKPYTHNCQLQEHTA